jgi:2-oxoisovalerate dehydrogenase E2 component (dihydrolipoyl transacylase)
MAREVFNLPDLGEGLTEATVIEWFIKVGDEVELNQKVLTVETAKAIVELPSPFAGVVTEILVAEDVEVPVGGPLFVVGDGDVDHEDVAQAVQVESATPTVSPTDQSEANGDDNKILVGVLTHSNLVVTRRRRRGAGRRPVPDVPGRVVSPLVRKLARQNGVQIADLRGSGSRGEVTRSDVEAALASRRAPADAGSLDEFPVERLVPDGVRRMTADRMLASSNDLATATITTTVPVGEMFVFLEKLNGDRVEGLSRLRPMSLIARALIVAVRDYPMMNASWAPGTDEILIKSYVNLGIAVDSPRGLLVPNVKNAQQSSIWELTDAIERVVEAARTGRASTRDLTGGSITITNIGAKANVETGTPLLNPPEAAILATGRIVTRPWVFGDEIRPEKVMSLSLSVDHRVIDGAQAGAFLDLVATYLSNPWILALRT